MAEAIVSLAIQRINGLLIQEAVFLSGVKEEVTRLQEELKRILCFLKDADRRQDQDERVRNWVAEIRGVAYDAEDVIETFILEAATGRGEGASGIMKRFTSIIKKVPHIHEIRNQIESIRTKICDISSSLQTYDIKFVAKREWSSSASEMQQRLRRSYPHDEDEHVISFDAVIRDLKAQLMIEEERLRVVSIVGIGGLGKTTLAKKVYNDNRVKQHFDCYAWAFMSQQFSVRDLLVRILTEAADKSKLESTEQGKEIMKGEQPFASKLETLKEEDMFKSMLERMKEEDLVKKLYKVLEEKRYLVVLDDIWSNEAWDCLKRAFPNGKKGSKVLLTTRNKKIASSADPWSSPVEPPFLTSNEAWELLRRKAFPNHIATENNCPPEFEKLGREMVKKCGALPLAVVVLGGLLATKKTLKEWEIVQRSVNAQFTTFLQQHNQYAEVYGILALSFHDLPFHLKPCFLYLSQFPEDWEFQKRSLIRMWIAEGFVAQPEAETDITMEDIAEHCLEELVSRCMVQVSERDHTGIGVKTFRVHDLMRDMCISKARDENFAGTIEHRDSFATNTSSHFLKSAASRARRIAIHPRISGDNAGKRFYVPLVKGSDPHVRSLHYFVDQGKYRITRGQEIYIIKKFKLLRVLNLKNIYLSKYHMPREIGNLIHLRYLGLSDTGLWVTTKCMFLVSTSLPASIGNLKSLYTLDVRNNSLQSLPDVLWKLENLRHVLVNPCFEGRLRLDTLAHLETLKWMRAKNLIARDAVLKLTNIRNLGVYFEEPEEVEIVLNSINLGRLRSLKMSISNEKSFPSLELLSGCNHLTKLELQGRISEDPKSLHHNLGSLPVSLVKLILSCSHLKQDPMCYLEKLPNLRFLSLDDEFSCMGSKMVCSVNGFPQLEILILDKLRELEYWQIEEGSMKCLKNLYLKDLRKLRMIPTGLKFVTTLQELKVADMAAFEKRVQVIEGVEGDDFDKVRHIPSVSVSYSWGHKVEEPESEEDSGLEEDPECT
ncbi:putative disease resistance protein At1g50180 [Ricinus communis]|uniref:putative disease resistance protein At1g50180 n=1 Tax=Ricinus communis TaxID=3988 RepID=UPI00201A79F4|nr:putative disease resistance protein At1g50180 [Ricinus communis]